MEITGNQIKVDKNAERFLRWKGVDFSAYRLKKDRFLQRKLIMQINTALQFNLISSF